MANDNVIYSYVWLKDNLHTEHVTRKSLGRGWAPNLHGDVELKQSSIAIKNVLSAYFPPSIESLLLVEK